MYHVPVPDTPDIEELHTIYLQSHGKIEGHAHNRFSRLHGAERDEMVAEVVARAYSDYHRRHFQGKEITPEIRGGIAKYAAKTVASGRRLVAESVKDVMSRGHSLGEPREHEAAHDEPIEDGVALRLDMQEWLKTLPTLLREVARMLSEGQTHLEIGEQFGFSRGWTGLRIAELRESWEEFFGTEE